MSLSNVWIFTNGASRQSVGKKSTYSCVSHFHITNTTNTSTITLEKDDNRAIQSDERQIKVKSQQLIAINIHLNSPHINSSTIQPTTKVRAYVHRVFVILLLKVSIFCLNRSSVQHLVVRFSSKRSRHRSLPPSKIANYHSVPRVHIIHTERSSYQLIGYI